MEEARAHSPHWAELAARAHLEGNGLRHLASNYRLRGGELDLVMLEGNTVVVFEVKQRKDARYGHPAEALDARKLKRVHQTALHYVTYVLRQPEANLRFDAVLILGNERSYRLEHSKDIG